MSLSGSGRGRHSKLIKKSPHHADLEREASLWEDAVLPQWEQTLIPALVEATTLPQEGSVLLAETRTGFVAEEVLKTLPEAVRCIAIEPSREMLDIARMRRKCGERRVWWDARSVEGLPYQADVFGASVCAASIWTKDQLHKVGTELTRVTAPGGAVSMLVPLKSTFSTFYDLFREGMLALEVPHFEPALDAFLDNLFDVGSLRIDLQGAGVKDATIKVARLPIKFVSGEAFLLSPLVSALFLQQWLDICPDEEVRQDLFYYVTDAMDTYFHGLELKLEAEVAWVTGKA